MLLVYNLFTLYASFNKHACTHTRVNTHVQRDKAHYACTNTHTYILHCYSRVHACIHSVCMSTCSVCLREMFTQTVSSCCRKVIDKIDQSEFEGFEYVNPLLMSQEDCV